MTTSRRDATEQVDPPAGVKDSAKPQGTLLERTLLDEQMASVRRTDLGRWGLLSWLGPLFALAATIAAGRLLVATIDRRRADTGGAIAVALTVGAELLLLAALIAFGRPLAARWGGWQHGLGLDRIRGTDWLPWITGFGFVFIGRTVVNFLANGLTDGKATAQANNLHLAGLSPTAITIGAVAVVVLAPVTEELMFRGLLLRTFMRRLSFWPAALLSTALFALFHVYEVQTLVGAVTLALSVAVLGLGNCYLVRITGRLTPGMMVHATYNGLALLVALALAAR